MYLVHIYAYPYKYTYIQVLMAQNSCISQPYCSEQSTHESDQVFAMSSTLCIAAAESWKSKAMLSQILPGCADLGMTACRQHNLCSTMHGGAHMSCIMLQVTQQQWQFDQLQHAWSNVASCMYLSCMLMILPGLLALYSNPYHTQI